jgi:hypothetical protein
MMGSYSIKSGGIVDDRSDHAEEDEVEPRHENDVDDHANVKENVE